MWDDAHSQRLSGQGGAARNPRGPNDALSGNRLGTVTFEKSLYVGGIMFF